MCTEVCQLVAEVTLELAHSHIVRSLVGRTDEVGYSLCLRQVHLAIEEGTLRKLARSGWHATILGKQEHNLLKHIGRAVARNLHRVLACIRMRRAENGYEHLVDNVVVDIDYIAEGKGIRLAL